MTACIPCYISNKFVYSISLSNNSPDKGPLLEMSRIEYFYLFQIVASENSSLGVVHLSHTWFKFCDISFQSFSQSDFKPKAIEKSVRTTIKFAV